MMVRTYIVSKTRLSSNNTNYLQSLVSTYRALHSRESKSSYNAQRPVQELKRIFW